MVSLKAIQDRVSMLFYYHGLLCASHPFAIISLVITAVMFMCYPLVNMPLPANAPLEFVTPVEGYSVPPSLPADGFFEADSGDDDMKSPRWYFGSPIGYVQQIIVRSAVWPKSKEQLRPSDAYRALLSTVFDLLEHVDNFQLRNGSKTLSLSDVCLHVTEITSTKKSDAADGLLPLLPTYNCLQLSPAQFWNRDRQRFLSDPEMIRTILKVSGASSWIRDILFGVPWKNVGIKRLASLFKHQNAMAYAVTILFKNYDTSFITGLREHLLSIYPLSKTANASHSAEHLVHVHYRNHNYIVEYTPLMLAYVVLCLYLYFSVRKIDMVKSKWGLAFSAMITVFASLLMSISLCVFFGLTPSLSGSEIFPYLVVVIGLENILVVTKSVVSTPVHLEVKLRIAQGLQNEGWYIFRHLMTELLVLVIGFFTFVPAIQEFCLFAVLGLGSDFFLQMFFFTTVLSIDIRRMELSDLQHRGVQEVMRHDNINHEEMASPLHATGRPEHCPVVSRLYLSSNPHVGKVPQSGSRRVVSFDDMLASRSDDVGYYIYNNDHDGQPRLLRLLNEWAQYRVFQRGIMLCVIIWILLIVYKTGLVEDVSESGPLLSRPEPGHVHIPNDNADDTDWLATRDTKDVSFDPGITSSGHGGTLLEHDTLDQWKSLSHNHWPTLLSYYNISLLGRYLTLLPSMHLQIAVSPEEAFTMRHPDDLIDMSQNKPHSYFDLPFRTSDVDSDARHTAAGASYSNLSSPLDIVMQRLIRYPRTKLEFVLTILLGIASLILFLYMLLELYKCMCSRNYAHWHESRQRKAHVNKRGYYTEIREAVPLALTGHRQEVECITFDGHLIVSSCLGGEIRVWDSMSGDCLVTINRNLNAVPSIDSHQGQLYSSCHDVSHSQLISSDHVHFSSPPADSPVFPCNVSPSVTTPDHPGILPERKSYDHINGVQNFEVTGGHRHTASFDDGRFRDIDSVLNAVIPDLTETIDTDFLNAARCKQNQKVGDGSASPDTAAGHSNGYNFTYFQSYFDERHKMQEQQHLYQLRRRAAASLSMEDKNMLGKIMGRHSSNVDTVQRNTDASGISWNSGGGGDWQLIGTAIWCLAYHANIIIAGCQNGTLEFWDALTGRLRGHYVANTAGVIAICVHRSRVIAARVNGVLDFLQYTTSCQLPQASDQGPAPYHASSNGHNSSNSSEMLTEPTAEQFSVVLVTSVRAHQQSVNVMHCNGDHVVTASSDHTLKVYLVDSAVCLYTLHGHTGGVSSLALDRFGSMLIATSGSEDASVRLWDINSGTCLHKLTGHDGTVTAVGATSMHVISVATDSRLCVWNSLTGIILHCLQLEPGYCNTLAILTRHLVITAGQGSLHLWDVMKGSLIRPIELGDDDDVTVFIRQLHVSADNSSLVCDYGSQLRIVRFTSVLEKDD